mmetsp:Transcript_40204/g.69361  ORF Transcript_40204/g.69361 Transcript_40204/m.69361 type:complete len:97 (+) Transcript_40204:362-652(+)
MIRVYGPGKHCLSSLNTVLSVLFVYFEIIEISLQRRANGFFTDSACFSRSNSLRWKTFADQKYIHQRKYDVVAYISSGIPGLTNTKINNGRHLCRL